MSPEMSEEHETPTASAALEAAADWLVGLQDEAVSGDDWLAFEQWLAASPSHVAAFASVERLWAELDGYGAELDEALAPVEPSSRRSGPVRARRELSRRRWITAAAAAVAASAAGVLLWRGGTPAEPWAGEGVVYEAAPGQSRQITLADGSHVRLNAGSRLAVRLDRDARRVQMTDAEATFDVAHDPARPFLIRAGDREVRVVGTEFNLRRRDGKMVLTVRRGLVEVRPTGDAAGSPTRVAVGQQLIHVEATGRSILTTVDPEEAFSWASGRLVYRDQPLSEVAADLSRRFARQVRTADVRTAQTPFTGVLILDGEAAVLERLQALAPVTVIHAKDGALVLRRHD
jgi:transmembrane sensor